ncbi:MULTISPECIES: glycosyltransferase [unclassified Rhizobium]|uniref:glycosyltransferase family 2 protein n=1 Tax=unclassified Rhizobium TaxID=2613769 RepID=UPI002889A202|nr:MULTISPECIES: glycosyltransferase [unclassified Rhizobium]
MKLTALHQNSSGFIGDMASTEEAGETTEKTGLHAFSDRPVAIAITASPYPTKRVCTVRLHRADRVPSVLIRSLLLDKSGKGVFYGWMPVGLEAISVEIKSLPREMGPKFSVRALSLVEMIARIFVHDPKSTLQLLRLLAVSNIRGAQFRAVRSCDGLNEPKYEDWREIYRKPLFLPQHNPNPPDTEVLISVVGDPSLAAVTTSALSSQSYPDLRKIAISQLEVNRDLRSSEKIWIRLPAGFSLDDDAVEHLIRPMIENPDIVGVYCDEDMIGKNGRLTAPFFKPAWNPPLARSGWLAPDGAAIRLSSLSKIENLESASAGELLLAAARNGEIAHVPVPLLHRPTKRPRPVLEKPRSGSGPLRVSVIIPTRDRADLLSVCLEGLLAKTVCDELDIIVIDNDSREQATFDLFSQYESRVNRVAMPGVFNFAKACNLGVLHARHDIILLLNNDVDPLHPEWLQRMAIEMEDGVVGACGPLLLFPDGFTQHAGVTLGAGSVARHSFHFRHPKAGEDQQLISQRREVSAVTAACLLTRKALWNDVGGMNEENLAVAFNDVDYCLKLRDNGNKIIWTPHARLTHLESVSRKSDDTAEKLSRFAKEEKYMHERWGKLLLSDPYYNPNLSLSAGDFVLDALPRDVSPRFANARKRAIK